MHETETPTQAEEQADGIRRYTPTDAKLAEMHNDYFNQFEIEKVPDPKNDGRFILAWKAPLTGKDDPRFPACMAALKQLTTCRTQVEAARKQFKAEHLAAGRKIDTDAAALNLKILQIERPIRDEKERVEAEARAAAEAKVKAEEDAAAAKAAEERRLADAAEAERKRVEEERLAAERKRLADERAAFEAQQAEAKRIADEAAAAAKKLADEEAAERKKKQDAIDAEHAKQRADIEAKEAAIRAEQATLRAEQDRIDREKREKEIREQAEKDAEARAERARKDREEADRLQAEREAAEKRAEDEARPDVEKIRGFGMDLEMGVQAMVPDHLKTSAAVSFLEAATKEIGVIIERLKGYGKKAGKAVPK